MKTGIFFLRFSILSTREQRFQAPETQVFENGPQSGVFLNRQLIVCVNKREQGFSNTVMS